MFSALQSSNGQGALEDRSRLSSEWVWWSAMALFVVAGATGALFRYGMVYGGTVGLTLENIRHAHSHLMYFGWGTPAMMVLIWRRLPASVTSGRKGTFRWIVGSTLAAALLAYPLFLLFGYSLAEVGSVRLPLAVMAAGLNMLCWYGFVGLYIATTRHLPRTGPVKLWDVAVGALVLATLGAWSLSLLPGLGVHNPLITKALTHVFLDLFSEGWFVLGALGLAFSVLTDESESPVSWAVWLVILGLPFTFLLGMSATTLPAELEVVGRMGGVMVGLGLLAMAGQIVRTFPSVGSRWLWGIPVSVLGLKAATQIAAGLVPGLWLGESHGLHVLYLHLMLLGFLTLALVATARTLWETLNDRDVGLFYGTVGVLLATLVPLTNWVPGGLIADKIALWAALGPVVVAAWMLVRGVSEMGWTRDHPVPVRDLP